MNISAEEISEEGIAQEKSARKKRNFVSSEMKTPSQRRPLLTDDLCAGR